MKTAEEFWAKVDKSGDCWEWTGGVTSAGYGSLNWRGKSVVAHRVAAFLNDMVADVSAPKNRDAFGFVLHRCDNRRCCNPSHFFVGTLTENMQDMYDKGRHPIYRGATHANAKLSQEDAEFIRALYATGNWKQVELAEKMGVSQIAISLIVRRKTYV